MSNLERQILVRFAKALRKCLEADPDRTARVRAIINACKEIEDYFSGLLP